MTYVLFVLIADCIWRAISAIGIPEWYNPCGGGRIEYLGIIV